jgi:hypothetical protein
MASKTQSGQLFSERTMNGIISIDDGAGTVISGGVIISNDISATNLTADFIQANNLLEADKDETITGEWTFTQLPYVLDAPTDPDQVVNKNYVDITFETKADASANFLRITDASNIYLSQIDASNIYLSQTDASNIYLSQTDASNIYLSQTDASNIYLSQIDASNIYQPIGDYITDASATALFVDRTTNQVVGGIKTFDDIVMDASYSPILAQSVATKAYADSLLVGSALLFGAVFGNGTQVDGTIPSNYTNIRLQDPADSPTSLTIGTNNVILGHRAAQYISGNFSRFNTYVGAFAGGNFQKDIINPFGLGNVFLGFESGNDGTGVGYQYNYTTNIGAYSYPSENNSTNIGGAVVRIHGYLKCPLYEAINTPSLNINTSGNGISLENNVRLFFDNLVGPSNHYTATSHFFTGKLYQFIGGFNYEILNTQTAYTKLEANTRYVGTGANNQTIAGIKTFTQFTYYKPGFVSYKLLSELEAYTKTEIDSFNFLTSGDLSPYLTIVDASSTYLSIVDASSTYLTIVDASGFVSNADFFNSSNTRLQDPSDSPTPFNGFNNTFVGYRSGQHANNALTGLNTFVGYQSGKHFAQGLAGGTSNTFLGANSGWDGSNTTPYGYIGTTCLGEFSVATADNQVVLGNSLNEVVINGAFRNEGSSEFNGTANFMVDAFRVIGGVSHKILSELDAYTKTEIDAFDFLTSASASSTYLSIVDASNTYLPIIDASGFASNAEFFNSSNTRLQDPSDSPTPFNGFNNTFVGYRSGQHANNALTGLNTFVGYQSGKHFAEGLAGGTSNTFLGANSGWDGSNTTPYGYIGTTCLGQFSVATADNQVVLGNSLNEVVINGAFRNEGSSEFNGTANFMVDAFRVIGGVSHKIISALDATAYQLKSNIRNSFDTDIATYFSTAYSNSVFQTIAKLSTGFVSVDAATRYYSASYSNATYQLLSNIANAFVSSTSRYYSASYCNSTFSTIANLVNVATNNTTTYFTTSFINANFAPKTLEYASWRYGVTSSGGTAATTSMTAGSNVFGTVGSFPNIQTVRAMGTGESAGQLDTSTGVWTCQITGMYSVSCQVTVRASTSARIFARYTQATGMFDALAMRSGLTQTASGSAPNGFISNHDLTIFLTAGDEVYFDFISTCDMFVFANQTYLYITRLTGY